MPDARTHPIRVAIVGVGNVGATFAYALLLSGLAAEIVLVDANRARPEEIEGLRQSAQILRATPAQLDLEGT